jgi:hypothetical protein
MKIAPADTQTVTRSHVNHKVAMGISKEKLGRAIWFLRDKIYTDKVLAVVREYICNAVDEHLKHGVDRPVQVTVPNALCPNFKVRDFGRGLTSDQMEQVFSQYFESTKDGENNSIGGFGIGSKAGHAYTDVFMVTSWIGGEEIVYSFSLETDPNGIVGGYSEEISRQPSDEPSGVEIDVPVREGDVGKFLTAVSRICGPMNYYGRPVVVTNCDLPPITSILASGPWAILHSEKLGIPLDSRPIIEMGGVLYYGEAVDEKEYPIIYKYLNRHWGYRNRTEVLVISAPIGSLSVAPSRETLEFNRNTEPVYQALLSAVESDIVKMLNDKVRHETCPIKKRLAFMEFSKNFAVGRSVSLDGMAEEYIEIPKGFRYRDAQAHGYTIRYVEDDKLRNFRKYGGKREWTNHTLVVAYHGPTIRRLTEALAKTASNKTITVIQCATQIHYDELLKVNNWDTSIISADHFLDRSAVESAVSKLPPIIRGQGGAAMKGLIDPVSLDRGPQSYCEEPACNFIKDADAGFQAKLSAASEVVYFNASSMRSMETKSNGDAYKLIELVKLAYRIKTKHSKAFDSGKLQLAFVPAGLRDNLPANFIHWKEWVQKKIKATKAKLARKFKLPHFYLKHQLSFEQFDCAVNTVPLLYVLGQSGIVRSENVDRWRSNGDNVEETKASLIYYCGLMDELRGDDHFKSKFGTFLTALQNRIVRFVRSDKEKARSIFNVSDDITVLRFIGKILTQD